MSAANNIATKDAVNSENSLQTITKTLQKLLKDSSKKHAGLRKGCQDAIDYITSIQNEVNEGKISINENGVLQDITELDKFANKLIIPLKFACETRNTKLMIPALDTIQKLMAYQYFRGEAVDEENPDKKLMNKVVLTISSCFDYPDDSVQLQIIKAFFTAVTEPSCAIHDNLLMNAIRTIYNIYLVSRNQVNQTTAKATLTQMLNTIFQRMEKITPEAIASIEESLDDEDDKKSDIKKNGPPTPRQDRHNPPATSENTTTTTETSTPVPESNDKVPVSQEPTEQKEPIENKESEEHKEPTDNKESREHKEPTEHKESTEHKEPIEETEQKEEVPATSEVEVPSETVEEFSKKIVESVVENITVENGNAIEEHKAETETITEEKPIEDNKPVISETEEPVAVATPEIHPEDKEAAKNAEIKKEGTHIFTDCFIIFRALCKLSTKEIPKDASEVNSIDLKSKLLSLELLLSILENSGPVFRSTVKFINMAIKKYLVMALLTNGVSPHPKVFRYSLSIFLALVSYFKDYLKNEIGVFYSEIFFYILESPLSTIQQKWMVLQVLVQICKNPQALVDIFVNYDCGLEGEDIYERMVNDLSKITQGKHVIDTLNQTQQEMKLKTLGLECMVTIMRSLVDWCKDLRKDFEEQEDGKNDQDEKEESGLTSPQKHPQTVHINGKAWALDPEHPDFHEVKQYKLALAQRIAKFNLSPKQGIRLLIEEGFVEDSTEAVARFLKTTEGLDKAKIGEYLGEKHDFNIKVLHNFIDNFSFKDMHIDIALRRLLSTFRLPGEAQKIDRMMEKFAERYFNQNPVGFVNADTVYLLAFAIIMLATDLHSHAIKEKDKMRKEIWIPMQLVNFKNQVDKQLLSDVFDRIAAQKLTVQGEDDEASVDTNVLADPRQRKSRFMKEVEKTILKSKQLIKERSKESANVYYRSKQIEHSRPMFEIACFPVLAAFSVNLEDSDDPEVISLCLDGFKNAIRVSCTFYMETERNTFVQSLAKFTFLTNFREMKQKNVESIKALMEIAITEGNYLQDCWLTILRCISQLEQLHVIGSGANPATPLEEPPIRVAASSSYGSLIDKPFNLKRLSTSINSTLTQQFKNFQGQNAHAVVEQIDSMTIDRVFTSSTQLNSSAIEEFVKSLVQISAEEIDSPIPRMFSLQKLVELAHFNMDRIRVVWTRIWNLIAEHFVKVGCNENFRICMYAVDSLKQLAMKFLEKNEMANYHFQKEFLKPFEIITAKNSNVQIRDMIIRCLSNMIHSRANNIKSGWKSIFVVFGIASTVNDESIVRLAFEQLHEVIERYFLLIADSFFIDCVNAFVAYGNNVLFIDISLKAISSLCYLAKQLSEGTVCPLQKQQEGSEVVFTDNDKHIALWWPILTGLAGVISHSHVDVRTAALTSLFKVLNSYGTMFNTGMWGLLFRGVLLPIFDNVRHVGSSEVLQEDNEWLTTTCFSAVNSLMNLFAHFFDQISFLLNDLLNLLVNMICQDNESLARIGATCFLQLVMDSGSKFTEPMWLLVCSRLSHILETNTPADLFKSLENESMAHFAPSKSELNLMNLEQVPSNDSANHSRQPSYDEKASDSRMHSRRGSVEENFDSSSRSARQSKTFRFVDQTPKYIKVIKGKSTVRLGLIETLNEIAFTHYSSLATDHLVVLLDTLERCYQFSLIINENSLLVTKISKTGLLDLLLRIEITAVSCYLRLLFRMYAEKSKDVERRVSLAEERLIRRCKEILAEYLQKIGDKNSTQQEVKRMVVGYTQIITQVLKGIQELTDDQLNKHLSGLYPLFSEMIMSESNEIRLVLKSLFVRIGAMKNI